MPSESCLFVLLGASVIGLAILAVKLKWAQAADIKNKKIFKILISIIMAIGVLLSYSSWKD